MRVYVLYMFLVVLMGAVVREWFLGVCGVVAIAALSQHDDMPRQIAGVTGLSISNMLLAWTLLMCAVQYASQRPAPKLPGRLKYLVLLFFFVIQMAAMRTMLDLGSIKGPHGEIYGDVVSFSMEYLLNPLKFAIPAILFYLGIRSPRQMWLALGSLLVLSLLYALYVIKYIPVSTLVDEASFLSRRHSIQRETGLHANDMALVMAQATWGLVVYMRCVPQITRKLIAAGCAAVCCLACLLCHSRGGQLALFGTGLLLAVLWWRRLLLFILPAAVTLVLIFPSVPARLLTGVGVSSVAGGSINQWGDISAGRTTYLWPNAMIEIARAPLLGHGRLGILTTEAYDRIVDYEGRCPTHPHNAYIEALLDGGLLTLLAVLAIQVTGIIVCASVARNHQTSMLGMAGAIGFTAMVTFSLMGVSGQSFWPRENTVLTTCALAIGLRAWTWSLQSRKTPVARG